MSILVTGATGQVGGAVVRALAESGTPVRALVRDTSRTVDLEGAEIVIGSFEDDASLTHALDGIDTVFLAGRDSPDAVALQRNVLQHAEQHNVHHVVKLSAIGARADSPIELMRDHHTVDQILKAGQLGWTLLQPHLYMQNLLRFADSVRQEGKLTAPMADKRTPLVDTRDVGEAAAAVLRNPSPHTHKTYQLTGPDTCSYSDVVAALSARVGKLVTYEPVSPEAFQDNLVNAGVPNWRAFDLAHIASAYAPTDCHVSPDFEALVGQRPTSIETFFKDYESIFIN